MKPRDAVVALAVVGIVVSAAVAVAACGPGSIGRGTGLAAGGSGPTVELTVYAASSLKDALSEIERAYEAATPGTALTVATDASSRLRAQIEQGAPADVFLAAQSAEARALVEAGLADGEAVDVAGNRLIVIVPADNRARIQSPADLAKPGIKVVAAGDEVPITGYAQRVVTNLAAVPGYPAHFAQAYAANIVTREENVKAVVAKIELGEGDAAIVYGTDARAATNVTEIEIPDAANVSATYAGVVIRQSAHSAEGRAFLTWLVGPEGTAILAGFGFLSHS